MTSDQYDGTLREVKRNPVYLWLSHYGRMSRGEIIRHIRSWEFNQEGTDLFEAARDSGLIKMTRSTEEAIKRYGYSISDEYEIADTSREDENKACSSIIQDYIQKLAWLAN